MVQQQFIIAELSQDSSVITAHITVGNHSHSQAQRSIEQRFQPNRMPDADHDGSWVKDQDIKIVENIGDQKNDQSHDSFRD